MQERLKEIRKIIKSAAPKATETIKYGLPTFVYHKNLVHFGAFKEHIGLYPGPEAITAHAEDLQKYKTSKGAIALPFSLPLPRLLIARIVRFRVGVIQNNLK